MTVQPQKALFRISYRMERRDNVAMTVALSRPAPARLAFEIAFYLLAVAILALGFAGSFDSWFAILRGAFSMPLALLAVPLVLAGPVILALRPQIGGLAAALLYTLDPAAGQDIALDLTSQGIEGGAGSPYSSVGWAAVTSLIETPTHLFVQIGPRQAFIIPRRAVAHEDAYRNLLGFIRARTGLATR